MDSFLNKFIVFLLALILILGIFISSFFIEPVFAEKINDVSFFELPQTAKNRTEILNSGINIRTLSNTYISASSSNTVPVYVFGFLFSTNYYKYVAVASSPSYFYYVDNPSSGSSTIYDYNINNSTYLNEYGLYIFEPNNTLNNMINIPLFDTIIEGLEAVSDYIESSNTFESLYDGLNIPRGYFARIEFQDNSVVDSKNILLTTNWPDYRQVEQINQSQKFKYDGGSSAESVLSYGGFSPISYTGTGNADIFGGHKSGISYFNGNQTKYLYVINPVYTPYNFINSINMNFNGGGQQAYNSNITLHDPDGIVKSVRIYAITESIGSGLKADYNVDDNEGANAIVTNGGLAWEDDNGSPYNPPLNGNTGVSNEDSSNNFLDIIENAFNNLVEKIQHILTPAIGYFNTLLDSFNDFVHWLSNLWSWLPSPIVTLIEAVLYVSISVGLIKLVLK